MGCCPEVASHATSRSASAVSQDANVLTTTGPGKFGDSFENFLGQGVKVQGRLLCVQIGTTVASYVDRLGKQVVIFVLTCWSCSLKVVVPIGVVDVVPSIFRHESRSSRSLDRLGDSQVGFVG